MSFQVMGGRDSSTQRQHASVPVSLDEEVAIVGAGPYGLSAAAHLRVQGIEVRVFGKPMAFWAEKMPEGMLLRSPRVASNIADPTDTFTLESYELAFGKPPSSPVSLETFVNYGEWFSKTLSSSLDTRETVSIRKEGHRFVVTLSDGGTVRAGRVIIAAGIGSFKHKPEVFKHLDSSLASHCYEGRSIRDFIGKRVVVIGAGQSALESAALLHEAGAEVEVIAKIPQLRWIGKQQWLHQLGPISSLLYSYHDIGPAGISRLVSMPHVIRKIPRPLRDKIDARAIRPAGSKWLPERLRGVKITTGRIIVTACELGGKVSMKLDDGSERSAQHVLLGTGYDVDVSKYGFISPDLLKELKVIGGYPVLSAGFCSSIRGLHFIGATAARSFGPLVRFVTGTKFTSRELTAYLSRGHRD